MAEIECGVSSTINGSSTAKAELGKTHDFRKKIDQAIAKMRNVKYGYDGAESVPPRPDSIKTLEDIVAPGNIDLSQADSVSLLSEPKGGSLLLIGTKGDKLAVCEVVCGGVVSLTTGLIANAEAKTRDMFRDVHRASSDMSLVTNIVHQWLFGE